MKQLHFKILILISLSLIFGCKPNQIVTEKIYSQIDSSAVTIYKNEISQKEALIASLQSDLNRFKEESLHMKSEMLKLEIYYDTNAPIDTITKKLPVSSEIITINNNWLQNSIKEKEILLKEANIENVSLATKYKKLQLTVEAIKKEKRILKEKTDSFSCFNYKIFSAGIIVGILFYLISYKYIRKQIKR